MILTIVRAKYYLLSETLIKKRFVYIAGYTHRCFLNFSEENVFLIETRIERVYIYLLVSHSKCYKNKGAAKAID